MKRTLLLLLVALLPMAANAYDAVIDGIYYDFSENEATVTYQKYQDYYYTSDYSGAVVIPESVTYNGKTYSVTRIGDLAFYGCSGLTSITIPNSVTIIGGSAFSGCISLNSIIISENVTSIGRMTFLNCRSLTSITIPNRVSSIGFGAFEGCCFTKDSYINNSTLTDSSNWGAILCDKEISDGLLFNNSTLVFCRPWVISITIPNCVTSIGDGAFEYCSRLTSITIPNSVTSIGKSAFYSCSGLTSVTIPNSVTSIGEEAFENCTSLTSVTIGNSVTSIDNGAFMGCLGLTSVTIPNSVTSIGDGAFCDCSGLTSITIPSSVTNIGSAAFNGTGWYNNQPDGLVYAGKVAYKYKGEMPDGTEIVLKNGTLGIAVSAFQKCSSLTSIIIPNSLTTIGSSAFYGCI